MGLKMEAPKTNTVQKWSDLIFWCVEILAQMTGVALLVTVGVWVSKYHGGFEWGKLPGTFSYHSFFGLFGLVFICGQAIIFIEIPKRFKVSALVQKAVHATIHSCAVIFAIVSLRAAILNKDLNGGKHLYSIHSWLGVVVIILFFIQYVVACVMYGLARVVGNWLTDLYQSTHAYTGLFVFVLAMATCLAGFTEVVQEIDNHSTLSPAAVLANISCLLLVLFGASVAYVASRPPRQTITTTDHEVLSERNMQDVFPYIDNAPCMEKDGPNTEKDLCSTEEGLPETESGKDLSSTGYTDLDKQGDSVTGRDIFSVEKEHPISKKSFPDLEIELSNAETKSPSETDRPSKTELPTVEPDDLYHSGKDG